MNDKLIISYLQKMNEDEIFYKKYYQAQSSNHLDYFLQTVDRNNMKKRKLIMPELFPDSSPTNFPDETYFNSRSNHSVYLSKHNRYTPVFLHSHVFFEIIYVLSGIAHHKISGEDMLLKEGDLCMVSPTVKHSLSVMDDDSIILNIIMRKKTIEDIFYSVLRDQDIISSFFINGLYTKNHASYLLFHTSGDQEIQKAILEMYIEQMEDAPYSNRIISSMLIIFYTKLIRKYKKAISTSESSLDDQEKRNQIFHYILEHIQDVSLYGLADYMNYSVPYCSKLIKNITGYNYSRLIRKIRFEKAESLLKNTSLSIQTISQELGYESPENFMHAFKKEYHLTPSDYRKNINPNVR